MKRRVSDFGSHRVDLDGTVTLAAVTVGQSHIQVGANALGPFVAMSHDGFNGSASEPDLVLTVEADGPKLTLTSGVEKFSVDLLSMLRKLAEQEIGKSTITRFGMALGMQPPGE